MPVTFLAIENQSQAVSQHTWQAMRRAALRNNFNTKLEASEKEALQPSAEWQKLTHQPCWSVKEISVPSYIMQKLYALVLLPRRAKPLRNSPNVHALASYNLHYAKWPGSQHKAGCKAAAKPQTKSLPSPARRRVLLWWLQPLRVFRSHQIKPANPSAPRGSLQGKQGRKDLLFALKVSTVLGQSRASLRS